MFFQLCLAFVFLVGGTAFVFCAVPNARIAMWLVGSIVMLLKHYQIEFDLFPVWQAKALVLMGAFFYSVIAPEYYVSEVHSKQRTYRTLGAISHLTMWLLTFIVGFSLFAIWGGSQFDWVVTRLIEVVSLLFFVVFPLHFGIASAADARHPVRYTV